MKALLVVLAFFVVFAVASPRDVTPACLQQYRQCAQSQIANVASCENALMNCTMQNCNCFDIMSGASTCMSNSSSDTDSCASWYTSQYRACAETCMGTTGVTELHGARARVVRVLGLPSSCDVCTAIVDGLEELGNDAACDALDLADLVPGCDLLLDLCGEILSSICSAVLSDLEENTSVDADGVCADFGFCSSGDDIIRTPVHRTATVVSLSHEGARQFLQRSQRLSKTHNSFCWGHNHHSYSCMEIERVPHGHRKQLKTKNVKKSHKKNVKKAKIARHH